MDHEQTTRITCSDCLYQWNYKGKLRYATCPNCRKMQRRENGQSSIVEYNESPKEKMEREGMALYAATKEAEENMLPNNQPK